MTGVRGTVYGTDPSEGRSECYIDVECPKCGGEAEDLEVIVEGAGGRSTVGGYCVYRRLTYSAECPSCGYGWEWDEEDERDPDGDV